MQGINFLRPGCCTLQLNVSRNVILEAYEMLLAEGLAIARSGSGTYVAEGPSFQVMYPHRLSRRLRLQWNLHIQMRCR